MRYDSYIADTIVKILDGRPYKLVPSSVSSDVMDIYVDDSRTCFFSFVYRYSEKQIEEELERFKEWVKGAKETPYDTLWSRPQK